METYQQETDLTKTKTLFYQTEDRIEEFDIPIGEYTKVNELMPSKLTPSRLEKISVKTE
jgi:hypothetical protein